MGPTPQHRSNTTSSARKESTSRLRSVPSLLFQYIPRKSIVYTEPFSLTVVSSGPSPPAPASTSMAKVLYGPPVSPVLFTTVSICGSLSRSTDAMTFFQGSCSSRRLRCTMVPAVSNPVGTVTSWGRSRRRHSSASRSSYPRVMRCVTSWSPSASSFKASRTLGGSASRLPSTGHDSVSRRTRLRSSSRCCTRLSRGRSRVCRRSLAMRPPTADRGARTASTSTSVANLGSFLSTGLSSDAVTDEDEDADDDAHRQALTEDGRVEMHRRRWNGAMMEVLDPGPDARMRGCPALIAATSPALARATARTAVVDMPPTFGAS